MVISLRISPGRVRQGRGPGCVQGGLVTSKRLALLAGAAVLAYFLFSLTGLVLQGYQLAQRTEAVQADIERLRRENEQLQAEVKRLESDSALELLAREHLGYVKEGETGVVIDFGPAGPPRDAPTPTPTPAPNWRQWWSALFGP